MSTRFGGKSKELKGHKGIVTCVSWSSDGRRLASSSSDSTIRIWSTSKDYSFQELKGHHGSVDQVIWSPTHPDVLASTGADKTVRIWNLAEGTSTLLSGLEAAGLNMCWEAERDLLAIGSKDDIIRVFNGGKQVWIRKFKFEINQMTWSNQRLILTTGLGTILQVDMDLEDTREFYAHTSNCYCIDGRDGFIVVGAADALVSVWDTSEMSCVNTIGRMEWPIRSVSISSRTEFVASGSEDQYIDVSSIRTGEQVAKISVKGAVNSIAWNPKKTMLAYAAEELDPRTNRPIGNLYIIS